jgi:putative oxidoreductase
VWPLLVRLAAGAVFISFSLGKFTRHDAEVGAFERYGIPLADPAVYALGTLEFGGGVLLVCGLATRPVALMLAGAMAGAIVTAGRIDGGVVNLGLAPALLVAMLALVWAGAGARSIDRVAVRALA